MRLAVIGKEGQLARALGECADTADMSVTFVARPDIDLTIPESVLPILDALKPDALINAAAYTAVDRAEDEPDLAFRINADAPRALAAWASRSGVPFVHLSTDYVFDGSAAKPYTECDTPNPMNVYGASKFAGETAVRESADDHLIIRTSWVFSPFGQNFVKTMLRLAGARDEVRVVADQIGNPTAAHDLAGAIFTALRKRFSGARFPAALAHFAGSTDTSWADFAREIFAASKALGGPFAEVQPIPSAEYPTRAQRPANSRLDSAAFERDFECRAPDLQASLKKAVARLIKGGHS